MLLICPYCLKFRICQGLARKNKHEILKTDRKTQTNTSNNTNKANHTIKQKVSTQALAATLIVSLGTKGHCGCHREMGRSKEHTFKMRQAFRTTPAFIIIIIIVITNMIDMIIVCE